MIAQVIPIKRMPRTLGLLSYTVLESDAEHVQVGQLVRIPLRSSTIYGIIFSIEKEMLDDSLKSITDIVHTAPLFTAMQLSRIISIAQLYGVSYGTASTLFTPPLQKRKIKQQEWTAQENISLSKKEPTHTAQIEKIVDISFSTIPKKTLILVPEINDITTVVASLPKEADYILWHSNISTKEQFKQWFAIHDAMPDYIIGTRAALFLPFQKLSAIYMYKEHDSAYKQWDGQLRYDTRDLLPLWAKSYRCTIVYNSYSPRFETYYHVAKKQITASGNFLKQVHAPLRNFSLVSLSDEKKAGNYDILSEAVQKYITSSTKNILLYVNRKGYAAAIGCTHCDFVSRCTDCGMAHIFYASSKTLKCHYCRTSIRPPIACPECKQTEIIPYGVGTEQVESYIKKTFPSIPHNIVRIDGNTEISKEITSGPTLHIGTEKVFSIIDWDTIEMACIVHIDESIHYPDYRSAESVWHTLKLFDTFLPKSSTAIIQTNNTEHVILKSMLEPERIYRTDLAARKKFELPPYTTIVRLNYGGTTDFAAKKEAERVFQILERTLTTDVKFARVSYPIASFPTWHRGKYWYTIIIKIQPQSWHVLLPKITALLSSTWYIDVSPQSLLSP